MTMQDKIVIVTGASSGIGAATALLFAKEGANVAITYKKNKEGAEKVGEEIKNLGRGVIIEQAELGSQVDAKRVIDAVMQKFGRLDVLVNNAGGYIPGEEWDGTPETWIPSISQNLISVMNMSKLVIQIFQKQQSGVIINLTTRYVYSGQPDALAYSASKAAVLNATQAYAKLLAPFGRANAVSPAAVRAGYWTRAPKEELDATLADMPLGLIEPEDIANTILFLASDKARMITGQNIPVDAGFSLK
jgi:3-oxoacyl-[acyl-carrier protein] reductase